MRVDHLCINNYRNIEHIAFEPDPGINVIFGENAQGKTNLIESIWLFSGFRSFRGSKDNDLIRFDREFLHNEMSFYGAEREQNAKIIISRNQKKILLNSVPITASSKLIGHFNCVVFSPSYLSLVKGNPSERRKFIDTALCQTKPVYAKLINDYNKVLVQRNSFLKDLKYSNKNLEFLDIWDAQLAEKSALIVNERIGYIKKLTKEAGAVYQGLSSEKEKLSIAYKIRVSANRYETLIEPIEQSNTELLLRQNRENDIRAGNTSIGAHRDEIEISINGISAKNFGSQGQQRSCALALKLGEAQILRDITGEIPVALLDDVMSELDIHRQDYILNHIKDWQVFITCCEPSTVLRLYDGKAFEIKQGSMV